MKKSLSIFLSIILIVSSLAFVVCADEVDGASNSDTINETSSESTTEDDDTTIPDDVDSTLPEDNDDVIDESEDDDNDVNENSKVIAFCERLYSYCLNRESDEEGIKDWTRKLVNKEITGAEAGYGFVFSKEYIELETSDEDYIKMLYLVFLDREYDDDGLMYWMGHLNNGHSREYIFSGFVNSIEYNQICLDYGIDRGSLTYSRSQDISLGATKFVMRLYQIALGREYDSDGLNYWCKELANETCTYEEVAKGFVNSKEFLEYELDDKTYLETLYRIFLNREADGPGLNGWMEYLKENSRDDVLSMFAYSKEFCELIKTFGRPVIQFTPVIDEGKTWVEIQIEAGNMLDSLSISRQIIERAFSLCNSGIKYDFGAKIPENGGIDCSGYVTDVFRRVLGTMSVTNKFVNGQTDGDGGRGSYYNLFLGYQSLTHRGTWNSSSSLEGLYSTGFWAGNVYVDKYGIGSPDIMDVSQWKNYLDRLGVANEYIKYSSIDYIDQIKFNADGSVLSWGSWEFLKDCKPGDIVMWNDAKEVFSIGNDWNHIGIYAGNGMVFHSSSTNYTSPDMPYDMIGVQLSSISLVRSGFQDRKVGGMYIYHIFSDTEDIDLSTLKVIDEESDIIENND